jgi:hypothetical protein
MTDEAAPADDDASVGPRPGAPVAGPGGGGDGAGGAEPPEEPLALGWRRRPLVAVVAVVVVLAFAGAALGRWWPRAERSSGAPAPAAAPEAPPVSDPTPPDAATGAGAGPVADPALTAAVEELSAFVAAERGRPFLRPVEVTLLDDEAFAARAVADLAEQAEEIAVSGRVLQALGLVEPGVDVAVSLRQLFEGATVGFYDPRTEELVLRGEELSASVRVVLVHELTHALDDQHHDVERPEHDDADDESPTAFSALVEGTATVMQEAYRRSLPPAERAAAAREEAALSAGAGLGGVPPALVALQVFPYLAGPAFVAALVDRGGVAAVDAAYGAPPTTTEQVLAPERYVAGEGPVAVATPPAEGPVIDEGVIGEWALALLLSGGVPDQASRQAAAGWGGDRYVAWEADGAACVRADIAMDDAAEAAGLERPLRRWADDRPDARVEEVPAGLRLTSCA